MRFRLKLGDVAFKPIPIGFVAIAIVSLVYGSAYFVVHGIANRLPVGVINLAQFGIAALCFVPWLPRQPIAWRGGLELGFWMGTYLGLQVVTLTHARVSESAFLMNLDTLFVPMLLGLLGQRSSHLLWLASGLAFTGMVVMGHDGTAVTWNDSWALLVSLSYTVYLIRSEHWVQQVESLPLTATKMVSGAGFSLIWVLLFEQSWLSSATWGEIPWVSLIYLGAIATGLISFLQSWGQQRINAIQTSITLSTEPIWALLFALYFLREIPTLQGMLGGGIILIATLLSIVDDAHE